MASKTPISASQALDLGSLSERESDILKLAIDGLTDQQIGNRLQISASTVNSYWVRIRGKVGHLSRTELVSRIVQQPGTGQAQELQERIAALELELARATESAKNSYDANVLRVTLDST